MPRQFAPRVQVILHPLVLAGADADVQHSDSSSTNSPTSEGIVTESLDITEWLGDSCTITTSKSMLEPAGSFSIVFLDRRMGNDSIYTKARPMDAVEIRACHDGSKEMKTIMRGFISRIERTEAMNEDGTPVRRVSIQGQDLGKVWLTQYLHFLPIAKDQVAVLRAYGMMERYLGSQAKHFPGTEFVERMTAMLREQIEEMTAHTIMDLTLDFEAEGEGIIPSNLIQTSHDISIYQFMASLLDAGPFYELWIDDPGEGAAILRWRPLWSGPYGDVWLTADDIASIRVWRDDSRVHNWYFCYPRGGALHSQLMTQEEAYRIAPDAMDGRNYIWSQEKFYGWRKLEVQFALWPDGYPAANDQPTREQYEASKPTMSEWIRSRTELLKQLNQDNGALESCTIVCSGNEAVRAGTYIVAQKSEAAFMYYVEKVEHMIHLWHSFKTTVHGVRGARTSGDGSYLQELDLKGALK